jgi:hypothetical protein
LGAWEGKQRKALGRICGGWEVPDGGVGLGTDGWTGGALGARMGMLEIAVIEPVCHVLTKIWLG